MSCPRSFRRIVVTLATGLLATGIGVVARPAIGSTADRALAASLADGAVDPVLEALSAGQLVRSIAPPTPGGVSLPAVPLGFGLTGDQLPALEVTATPVAQQAVTEFLQGLRGQGIDASGTQWQVFTLPPVKEATSAAAAAGGADNEPLGSSLIVPAGTIVRFVGAVFQDGELHVKTAVTAPASPGQMAASQQLFKAMGTPADSVTFEPAGGVGCLRRKQNSTAHYDPCQQFWRATNDNSTARDWFASEMHGTGKSHSVWRLQGLEVDSHRTKNTALQEWVNWDPGADSNGNCQDQTVSVSYAGASVSISKPHCEMWDIDKGAEALDMSNWWRGSAWRQERSTAAVTLTTVKQGEVPTGDFDFDYNARP
jgi:hypothetical protein